MLDTFELALSPGFACLVMNLTGPSLEHALRITRKFRHRIKHDWQQYEQPTGQLLNYVVRQLIQALDFMHECKVGHGDLWTTNVCYGLKSGVDVGCDVADLENAAQALPFDSASIQIIDFGSAFYLPYRTSPNPATRVASVPGCCAMNHAAPEYLRWVGGIGPAPNLEVDIWSLGCLVMELMNLYRYVWPHNANTELDFYRMLELFFEQKSVLAAGQSATGSSEETPTCLLTADGSSDNLYQTAQKSLGEIRFARAWSEEKAPDDLKKFVADCLEFHHAHRPSARQLLARYPLN